MPSPEELRDLRDRIIRLEQQNKYLEDNYNQLRISSSIAVEASKTDFRRELADLENTMKETRKTLFEEREARQLLDANFKRVMARYGGWAAGATAVGGIVGYVLSKWNEIFGGRPPPGAH